jgi:phenylalanyl-tRNA synthetase alpha chain
MTDPADLDRRVSEIRDRYEPAVRQCRTSRELEALRVELFGKKQGLVTLAYNELRALPPEVRPAAGKLLNQLKTGLEAMLASRQAELVVAGDAAREIDLTRPESDLRRGTRHPITLIREELEEIFLEMGYAIAEGREVEDDFHNFGALNFPPDHPARDEQDTLFVGSEQVLRTHTSNVQVRAMEAHPPPLRLIASGRCYRRDTADLTHSPMFHQIEGLCIDEGVSMADLKGTLEQLSRRLFGSTEVRLRPSFFPFTEPSAELDISCFACARRGCALCKGSGFIELGGCGLVDPNVFRLVSARTSAQPDGWSIDPERWSGFAFGFGLERAAMLKYGIDSIRLFFEDDLRFLSQFPARV